MPQSTELSSDYNMAIPHQVNNRNKYYMNMNTSAAPISGTATSALNLFNVQSVFGTNQVRVSRLGN